METPDPDPSCVSLKSDDSKQWFIDFKRCATAQRKMETLDPDPSCVSLKSDDSKQWFIDFKRRDRRKMESPDPDPSCVSLKSDDSKQWFIDFTGSAADLRKMESPDSEYEPSGVSLKSDDSKQWFIDFKASTADLRYKEPGVQEPQSELDIIFKRLEEHILMFVKLQLRRFHRLLLSEQPEGNSDTEEEWNSREAVLNITVDFLRRMDQDQLAQRLSKSFVEEDCRNLKSHLQHKFHCLFEGVAKAGDSTPLNQIYTELYITEGGALEVNQEHEVRHIKSLSWKPQEKTIACEDIFKVNRSSKAELTKVQDSVKFKFKKKFDEQVPIETTTKSTHGPSEESEEKNPVGAKLTKVSRGSRIGKIVGKLPKFSKSNRPIRTVLTKGVAGVGKTVLTQKFSLDWAEGKANQDVQLLFPFTFRELNVLRDTEYSLEGLLHHFFSQTKKLRSFQQLQVLFIFDGLDECRLPLDFSRTRVLTEPTENASVEVLLVNLIRGNLLPKARLWITTRPAAANQIPAECVSMVTEVRGFTDPQKEQYFMKRFTDEQQTTAVISHIKSIRSVYIMCYIPIFCWIISTVLLHLMETVGRGGLPHTLTQMYIHFLVVHAKVKNIKYHEKFGTDLPWTPETRKMLRSLGKLAFEQLQKGNLIFYESDLSECGLDAAEIARYSGVFTEVFREEPGLYQDKVYCFIHLSVQEFLAALHVHQTFFSSGENLLSPPQSSENPEAEENLKSPPQSSESPETKENLLSSPHSHETTEDEENLLSSPHSPETTEDEENLLSSHSSDSSEAFYRTAVDRALQSPNGHLDLFLRFLLGLSLPTNQSLFQGLLTHTGTDPRTVEEIVTYIKERLRSSTCTKENSLNLFHCLNELHDRSLVEEIQQYMRDGDISQYYLSPAQFSALCLLIQSTDSNMEEFDLRKYCPSEDALLQLLPVVKESSKAILRSCGLSPLSCDNLASVLGFSRLTHLDLSNNILWDLGVKLLCEGINSTSCRVETLSLSGCNLTGDSCGLLATVLGSSRLTHLNLSNNHLLDSGVELLCEGLKSAPCRLQTLGLSCCGLSPLSCGLLASVLSSSSLTHLDLRDNDLQDSGVELLCEGLKSAPCRLQTLSLSGCRVSERGGASLASALSASSSPLRKLDLSYNHPGLSATLLTALWGPHDPLRSLRLDPSEEQWMVPGLRKYSCELTLDPDTAHGELCLSEDKQTVTRVVRDLPYPHHEDRFRDYPQVLTSSSLRGRCYWEVEWRGDWGEVHIAASYRGISRRGQSMDTVFGRNSQSWSLCVYKQGYSICHNNKTTDHIPLHPSRVGYSWGMGHVSRGNESRSPGEEVLPCGRVGVFLDSEAGVLSFFEVLSDGGLSHLHTFSCSATEPVFPGIWLGSCRSSATLVK